MQALISGTVNRLHRPLTIAVWDNLVIALAAMLCGAGLLLLCLGDSLPAVLAGLGSTLIFAGVRREQRRHETVVWALAALGPDPISVLALHEHLYGLPVRDLLVVARWHDAGHSTDCGHVQPPQVAAMLLHVRESSAEC